MKQPLGPNQARQVVGRMPPPPSPKTDAERMWRYRNTSIHSHSSSSASSCLDRFPSPPSLHSHHPRSASHAHSSSPLPFPFPSLPCPSHPFLLSQANKLLYPSPINTSYFSLRSAPFEEGRIVTSISSPFLLVCCPIHHIGAHFGPVFQGGHSNSGFGLGEARVCMVG